MLMDITPWLVVPVDSPPTSTKHTATMKTILDIAYNEYMVLHFLFLDQLAPPIHRKSV